MSRRYVSWLLSLVGALLVVFSFAAARADGPVRTNDNLDRVKNLTGVFPPQKPLHHPKLDFRLAELSYRSQLKIPGFFIDSADHSLIAQDGTVRAIAEALPQKAHEAALEIERLGGIVEGTFGNRTQFRSPPNLLAAIASLPQVSFVVPPSSVLPQAVTSQGVSVIRADQWHMKGYTGQGIKVGVLDLGFDGYLNLLGTELPNSVVAKSFRSDGDITGGAERHGTAVAEILHDVAPGAELVLANFSTEVEMGTAVRWLIDQGVKIISASFGWLVDAPGDGTGIHNEIVATARSAGVLWVNAAGNAGRTHWSGIFNDSDGNNWHNFLGEDETNTIFLQADQAIRVSLRWNDWDKRDQDFDLYLYNSDLSSVVKSSTNRQTGSLPPTETFDYSAPADGNYHIAIFRYQANRNVDFDLFVHIRGDPEPCAVQASVGNGPQANGVLGSLRLFRDSVLNSTAVGKKYVSLFYKHSREIARMILSDSTLRVRMASLLETVVVPALRSLGKDEAKFVVTRETVDELKALKQMVLGGATHALAADIEVAWQEVGLNNAEGKTTKELWEALHSLAANVDPSSSTPGELEYVVSNRSIVIPADSPNALTIGATYWADDQLRDYSSRGPTLDGRIKPDMTGPTGVLTQTYGEQGMDEFEGTSSSTPHVSGAAALVWSLFPLPTADEVQSYLETRAIDLGEPGKDNLYGNGLVDLDPADVAPPVLSFVPGSLNFGTVPIGIVKELAFTVQNTGGRTLTGSASTSAPFSIVGNNSFNLAANETQDITVRFSPPSANTFNGNVNFTSNGGDASPLVTGTGVPAPTQFTLTVNKSGTGSGTITSSPTGIKCGTDCDQVYAKNKIVKLAAKAATGSTFVGWSGACSGNGACSVLMNATKAVTANFNVFNLDIWYMEVNQAVQRINPDSLINEVSLVAEKDTIVRGYVRNKDPDSGLTGISGILYFSPSGQNRWKRIGKLVSGLITPVLIPQPEDTEKTLNFRIPGGFGEGEYDLKMEVHLGSQKTVLATTVTRIVFHKRKTLKILYTSVRYEGDLPTGNFSTSFSLLKGVFPLAFNPDQWIARSSINSIAIFPKAGCGFSLGGFAGQVLLETLAAERLLYNLTKSPNKRVDFIVGIMPKSRLDEGVDGCSSKLLNAAFVTDDSASIEVSIAHEVGHLLGLPIPSRGSEEYPGGPDGLGYPIDDGFKETSARKHFFSFSDPLMAVTKFHHLYTNFMGLANLQSSWVDELSYDLLFQNLSP